jgi:hypothetical protein
MSLTVVANVTKYYFLSLTFEKISFSFSRLYKLVQCLGLALPRLAIKHSSLFCHAVREKKFYGVDTTFVGAHS